MTSRSARDVALDALVRIEDGAYANLLLPAMLRDTRLAARDRAFATSLVYGTVRRLRALDHLLGIALTRAVETLDAPVRAALRMGAAQLVDGVPAHAAVSATVDACARRAPRARGFVNGVLRTVATLGPPWPWPEGDDVTSVGIRTSHPDWIVARLVDDLGRDDALALLAADNDVPALTLRPNPVWTTPDALTRELLSAGADVSRGALVHDALVVRGIGDPGALPAVVEGRATPQDQASQAVAALVGAGPGEHVLEVGSAPGGKATALGERIGDDGLVVALDANPRRTQLVRTATRRLGLRRVRSVTADGRALPFAPRTRFDRVLVDAPCSGLGVLRRRPEARWRVRPADVDALATLQRELVGHAATRVRPGGVLVYSVCTVTRAETVDVDEWLRRNAPGLEPTPPPGGPWRPWGRGALLLPQDAGTDGMFVLTLRSVGSGS